jgi:dipeptidyl aminopeptidase/acylaminoacyl peptidase
MDKAVLEYPDGGNIIYDFKTNKSVTLPSQWKDFAFSPTGDKIVFKNMMLDPEERYISTADTNGCNFTEIEALGDKDSDVTITWSPNNAYIALYREGLEASRSEIYPIGLNNENFVSLRVEGRDPRYIWSPSGNILLYSVFNSLSDFKPLLWFVSTDPATLGSGRQSIDLNTWADKCVFATESIVYCAVPRTLDIGAGYLPSLADNTPDDFYRINLVSSNRSLIAQPIFPTTASKLFVSGDQSSLYWLEKNSGQLKEIKLK